MGLSHLNKLHLCADIRLQAMNSPYSAVLHRVIFSTFVLISFPLIPSSDQHQISPCNIDS